LRFGKRNKTWTFKVNSNKEIQEVAVDPENKIPDVDMKNNVWKALSAKFSCCRKIEFTDYVGTFSSKQLPIKITFKVENNKLVGQAGNQQAIELSYDGSDKFLFEAAGLEIQFAQDKKCGFFLREVKVDFNKE
jgi:hypothetical protein